MSAFINDMVETLIAYGTINLIMLMIIVFVCALILKLLLYYLVKCEFNLSSAFETRTHRYLNNRYVESQKLSKFHDVVEFILRKTYSELYVSRKKQLRKRKTDPSVSVLYRMFLVEDGARSLIDDTLRQTKYHDGSKAPDFRNISKFVFTSNPYFTKLWGFIPIGVMNSVLAVLPGLFIIGGIFGTFLGISRGLPALKTIDPGNIAAAQLTLRTFLESMTFAMNSSVVGIFLSVCFTIVNAFLSLNTTYLTLVDKFTQSLELIWKETSVQG
jgi:hypothetical protein